MNHNGDHGNIITVLVLFALLIMAKFNDFEQIGPPIVEFDAIVPKGKEVFSYYDVKNPKEIKEEKLLELNFIDDPYLSHFRFKDVTKILPFSDPGCPNGGICSDDM